jgi:hypothetical protein
VGVAKSSDLSLALTSVMLSTFAAAIYELESKTGVPIHKETLWRQPWKRWLRPQKQWCRL